MLLPRLTDVIIRAQIEDGMDARFEQDIDAGIEFSEEELEIFM